MILHGHEEGAGPPVALLHGLFGSARNWRTVQRALAGRFRTIALDLRNHGASPHATPMDYATMAADVSATLAEMGAAPAALVGHSMGGKVAMAMALSRPDLVSRLSIVDIAPLPYRPAHRALIGAMQALPLGPDLTRAGADAALAAVTANPAERGFVLQNLRFTPVPEWRLGLAEIAASMPAIEDFAPPGGASYAGETLFIAGGKSAYIRPEYRDRITGLFPRARITTIAAAGHWVPVEAPEAFLQVLSAFLAE